MSDRPQDQPEDLPEPPEPAPDLDLIGYIERGYGEFIDTKSSSTSHAERR